VIQAVIDTNVLVSGLLSPTGNEALIVLAIHQVCSSVPVGGYHRGIRGGARPSQVRIPAGGD
jgi:hypothetical protein